MTLKSIFSLKERGAKKIGVSPADDGMGIKVSHWFWGAAKRIEHAADHNQERCECPMKQASNRLLMADRSKWEDCVLKVKKKGGVNPYAVCTTSVGVPDKRKERGGKKAGAPPAKVLKPKVHKPKVSHPAHHKLHPPTHPIFQSTFGRHFKQADSGTAYPAALVKGAVSKESKRSNVTFVARFQEAIGAAQVPTKFRVGLLEEGLGNLHDAYYYTREALESAVKLFEGLKIMADHPTLVEEEIRPERSVRDVVGHYENLDVEESDGGAGILCADLDTLPGASYDWVRSQMVRAVENAKKFPNTPFVGLSINASGDAEKMSIDDMIKQAPQGARPKLIEAKEKGIEAVRVVRRINQAVSCDLVTEAGAGGKIMTIIEGEKSDGKKS